MKFYHLTESSSAWATGSCEGPQHDPQVDEDTGNTVTVVAASIIEAHPEFDNTSDSIRLAIRHWRQGYYSDGSWQLDLSDDLWDALGDDLDHLEQEQYDCVFQQRYPGLPEDWIE